MSDSTICKKIIRMVDYEKRQKAIISNDNFDESSMSFLNSTDKLEIHERRLYNPDSRRNIVWPCGKHFVQRDVKSVEDWIEYS